MRKKRGLHRLTEIVRTRTALELALKSDALFRRFEGDGLLTAEEAAALVRAAARLSERLGDRQAA